MGLSPVSCSVSGPGHVCLHGLALNSRRRGPHGTGLAVASRPNHVCGEFIHSASIYQMCVEPLLSSDASPSKELMRSPSWGSPLHRCGAQVRPPPRLRPAVPKPVSVHSSISSAITGPPVSPGLTTRKPLWLWPSLHSPHFAGSSTQGLPTSPPWTVLATGNPETVYPGVANMGG